MSSLSIAGDVRTDEVLAQIREAYAKSQGQGVAPGGPAGRTQRRSAPREIVEEAPIELGHFHMAWHIPELRHRGCAASGYPGRHPRARPQFAAVSAGARTRKGSVHSVDAWTYNPGAPGLFGMSATVDAGQIHGRARRHARGN